MPRHPWPPVRRFLLSTVVVEVDHPDLEPVVRRVHFHRHHGHVHALGDGLGRGQGEFDALVRGVVARPGLGKVERLTQLGEVLLGVLRRAGNRPEEQRVVLGEHLVGPHGDGRTALEAVAQLPSVLVVRRAELQVVGGVEVLGQRLQRVAQVGAALRSGGEAAGQVEAADVHLLDVPGGDLQLVQVEEGHGQVAEVGHDLPQGVLLVGLAGQFHPRRDARVGRGRDAVHVVRGLQVQEVEAKFVEPGLGQPFSDLGVDGDGGVEVDVVRGTEGLLQGPDGLQRAFEVEHRVPARDAGARRVHRAAFFDDLLPRRAAPFVGEHVGGFPSVFRKGAVGAAPVALAGHEEDQLAARLALHAALRFAFLGGKDLGGHRQLHRASLLRPRPSPLRPPRAASGASAGPRSVPDARSARAAARRGRRPAPPQDVRPRAHGAARW